jgi:hypothetical protein
MKVERAQVLVTVRTLKETSGTKDRQREVEMEGDSKNLEKEVAQVILGRWAFPSIPHGSGLTRRTGNRATANTFPKSIETLPNVT